MLLIVPKYKLWITLPPLGILYIASTIRKMGEEVDLIDGVCTDNFYNKIDHKIKNHNIVGITANVAQAYSAKQIAEYIRKNYPDKKIIWGGPYSSIEYKKILPNLADIVVIGEGENQIKLYLKGEKKENIPGIAFWDKKKNRVVFNPRKEFISNLDNLPFPAWDLVQKNRYFSLGHGKSFIVVTERGCPFHCINCTKIIHGNKFRTRNVENIIDELDRLVTEFGAKEFQIWDDNFTLIPERAKSICRGIIKKGINKKARFLLPNGIRADICDDEMFDLMKEANFQVLMIAIESADQDVIDTLKKGLDLEKVRKTVETAVNKGFRVGLFFMMGLPFDTMQSLKKSAKFAASLPAHHVFFWRVTPFPGTKLYDIAFAENKNKTFDYMRDFVNYDGATQLKYEHPKISSFQIALQIRLAYIRFYANPLRIYRIIKKIIEEKSFLHDMKRLIICGIRIMLLGHR